MINTPKFRKIFAIIFVLLCTSLVYGDSDELGLGDIYTMIDEKNFTGALEKIDNIIDTTSESSELYYLRGICNNKLRKFSLAFEDFKKSYSINNRNDKAAFNIGKSLYLDNKYKDSLEWINKAIEINKDNLDYYFQRGVVLISLLEYQQAEQDFRMLTSIENIQNIPEFYIIKSYDYLSVIYSQIGEYDKFKKLRSIVKSLAPDNRNTMDEKFIDERYQIGNVFPPFKLKTNDDRVFTLDNLKGKKCLVFLWYPVSMADISIETGTLQKVVYDDFYAFQKSFPELQEDIEFISLKLDVGDFINSDKNRPWLYCEEPSNQDFVDLFNFDEGKNKLLLIDNDGEILLFSDGVFSSALTFALLEYVSYKY